MQIYLIGQSAIKIVHHRRWTQSHPRIHYE